MADHTLTRRDLTRHFYRKNKISFTVSLVSFFMMSVGNLMISWLLQQVVDAATGNTDSLELSIAILASVALIAGIVLIGLLEYVFYTKFITRAVQQYKDFAFSELTKKGISAFSGEGSSLYISALSNDIESIEQNYLRQIFSLVMNVTMFVGALAMMLWYSPLLTLVGLLFMLLPTLVSLFTGGKLAEAETSVSDKNESYLAMMKDGLDGFSVIKSFKAERQIRELFAKSNAQLSYAKCVKMRVGTVIELLSSVAGITAQLGVFIFSAYLALRGDGITPGVVVVFLQLMGCILNPVSVLPGIMAGRRASLALVDKLAAALNENVRGCTGVGSARIDGDMEMRDVSFSYDGEEDILKSVTATFEAGKSYAIVGASGSGKSTLLSLLMASRDDYRGEIRYGDRELREIGTDALYEHISVIQQSVFVFNASIWDNITMFREFPREEVERAIEMSGLSALVTEKGEDYLCGEGGCALSGGEKQRISIARALLRRTSVLLVDEATAALDHETAHRVSSAILALRDMTRIVVTHSLDEDILMRYDEILTLKQGRIVEHGTFDTLMAEKGYFYSLYTVSQ